MKAVVLYDNAKIMSSQSNSSDVLVVLDEGQEVEVEEMKSKLWWKVSYNNITGYIKTKFLKSENVNEDAGPIMISLPRDVAVLLYKALKFSLN